VSVRMGDQEREGRQIGATRTQKGTQVSPAGAAKLRADAVAVTTFMKLLVVFGPLSRFCIVYSLEYLNFGITKETERKVL
jgi:hypothetical protein